MWCFFRTTKVKKPSTSFKYDSLDAMLVASQILKAKTASV